jgi:prevent-host-death family protein
MKTAPIAEVKARLSAFVDQSKDEPVVITRNGRPVAVLLALADEDELERVLLGHSARLREVLEAGRQQIRDGTGIGHDEFWEGLGEASPSTAKPPRRKKA